MASLEHLFQQLRVGILQNEEERQGLRRSRDASDEGSQGRQNRPRVPPEWFYDEVLEYYDDGTTLKIRKHVDSNGQLHDLFQPALVEYYPKGQIKRQVWAVHGLAGPLSDNSPVVREYAENPYFDTDLDLGNPLSINYLKEEYKKLETLSFGNRVVIHHKTHETIDTGNTGRLISEHRYLARNVPNPESPDNVDVTILEREYKLPELFFQGDPHQIKSETTYYHSGNIMRKYETSENSDIEETYYKSGNIKSRITNKFNIRVREERWFQDTPGEILHRDGDAPALHIVNNAGGYKKIEFFKNGKHHRDNGPATFHMREFDLSVEVTLSWIVNGIPTRVGAPAVREWVTERLGNEELDIENLDDYYDNHANYEKKKNEWYEDGMKVREENWRTSYEEGFFGQETHLKTIEYFRNNVLHKEDGPAFQEYNLDDNEMINKGYWYYGNQYPSFELLQMRKNLWTPVQPSKDRRKEFVEDALQVEEGVFLTLEKYLEQTKEEDIDPMVVDKLKEEQENWMPLRQRAEQAFDQLREKNMEEEAPELAKARKTHPELNWSMRIHVT